MKRLLADPAPTQPLYPGLVAIAEAGFCTRDDCYVLTALLEKIGNAKKADFPDCTGYECFVNSVHVEDYAPEGALSQALRFIAAIFAEWASLGLKTKLVAIVSADELCVVVKFHAKRALEEWLSEDLEGYGDAIMSIDSSEPLPGLAIT